MSTIVLNPTRGQDLANPGQGLVKSRARGLRTMLVMTHASSLITHVIMPAQSQQVSSVHCTQSYDFMSFTRSMAPSSEFQSGALEIWKLRKKIETGYSRPENGMSNPD